VSWTRGSRSSEERSSVSSVSTRASILACTFSGCGVSGGHFCLETPLFLGLAFSFTGLARLLCGAGVTERQRRLIEVMASARCASASCGARVEGISHKMLTQDPRMLEYRRRTEAIHAVTRERVSIAREPHDIVAHSVTVMMLQSVAARRAVRPNPDLAEETLTNVDDLGITLSVAPRS
jgi:signal transduction histidine kinase